MGAKNQFETNLEIAAKAAALEASILAGQAIPEAVVNRFQDYAGAGGLIKQGATGRGVLYEYYTPIEIVEAMWALAHKHGFTGGKILEPSCGIGRMLKYVDPASSSVDAFEFSKDNNTSYLIAKASYPWANITNDYFESIFYTNGKREAKSDQYDLVIGNPPYGKWSGFYAGPKREGAHYKAGSYDQYFIMACIDLLKQNGLLVFIIPSSFLNSPNTAAKEAIAEKAELIDAYRLPERVFDFTGIGTDIIVLRKK